MATTTPNNGWTVPTSTDYVKDGATAIETLGDAIDASVGTGLLAWQSWAPTLSGGWLNGNGTWTASYVKIGKIVHVRGRFVLGSTTTKGTTMSISLPVTAAANQVSTVSGAATWATVAGTNTYLLFPQIASTTTITMFAPNVAGTYMTRANLTAAIPATWATSDEVHFSFTYEAA